MSITRTLPTLALLPLLLSTAACGDSSPGGETDTSACFDDAATTETGDSDGGDTAGVGATPEEGLRAALGIDGAIATQSVTLDNGDLADVYAPAVDTGTYADSFPVAVLLQGGLVPAAQYSEFATSLAGYGFVVVVPEHLRPLPPMFPDPVPLSEANVIPFALDAVATLDDDPESIAYQLADTSRAVLTGHSQGGLIALFAVAGQCLPGFCVEPFSLPSEIQAAALYGAHTVQMGVAIPIDTALPVALVQGGVDGNTTADDAQLTYDTLEPPRGLLTLADVNHFGITNDNVVDGALPDDNTQPLAQSESVPWIALWSAMWLHAALDGPAREVAEHWLFATAGAPEAGVSIISDALDG